MRSTRPSIVFAILAGLSLAGCRTAPPPAAAAPDAMPVTLASDPREIHYGFLFSGNRAGSAASRVEADGTQVHTFEFNDRGRGSNTTSRYRLDAAGLPTSVETTGVDYLKSPVDERFERKGTQASWKSSAEKGEREVREPAFFLSLNGPPQEAALLAKALLAAPGHRLPLLPTGEARIEELASEEVRKGGVTQKIRLYALSGLGFAPSYVWLDENRDLFASVGGWAAVFREGWVDVVPKLTGIQSAAEKARYKDLAARLTHHPQGGGLAIRHARLFDPATLAVQPDMTVIVSGNRIQAVGKDGEVQVPPGVEVIDARGKTLLPGLWDMHVHLSESDGLFNLAAGVTSVRDMANDIDELRGHAPALGFGGGDRPARAEGRLHRRPRPLRRPHQGPGLDRAAGSWSGWTAMPGSATCRSSSTARSIPGWCRRSSSAPTSWACGSPAISPTA